MKLIAIRGHRYPPMVSRGIGEEYDAPKGDAVVLVAANLAKYAKQTATRPAQYETKEHKPEPRMSEQPVSKKRQYRRNEMIPK